MTDKATTKHRAGRLAKVHYQTASGLRWMFDPPKDWPRPTRPVKQRASLWLNKLAAEAGIKREGLTREQVYLESIRAIIAATGKDESFAARKVQGEVREWDGRRGELWKREAKAPPATKQAVIKIGGDHPAVGLLKSDLITIELEDVKAGDLCLVQYMDEGTRYYSVGFIRHETEGEFTLTDGTKESWFEPREVLTLGRVVKIEREVKRGAPPAEDTRARRLAELRRRLESLETDDITNSTAAFKIEKEIYDLEHSAERDEWPEVIGEREVA